MMFSDAEIEDLKRRCDLAKVAIELGANLRARGGGHVGSCPLCGGKAKATRFEIKGDSWVCAVCPGGGDVIELVRRATGATFAQAVERLGGVKVLSAEEQRQLAKARKDREAQEAAKAESYRLRELNAALRIWKRAVPVGDHSLVMRYLASRGLALASSAGIREMADTGYYHGTVEGADGKKLPRAIHHGPAMVSAFEDNDGQVVGVHITYLRPDGLGKVKLTDPDTGDMLPAKKMRGAKAGCHIVLRQKAAVQRLFLSEGIETGLSVARALHKAGKLLPGDAFWAAGDLGNMGGPAAENVLHPTEVGRSGRPRRVPGPKPGEGPAIAIPDSVHTLVLLGDGDSERVLTTHALHRARARYAKPGRAIAIAMAPEDMDFNDMIEEAVA